MVADLVYTNTYHDFILFWLRSWNFEHRFDGDTLVVIDHLGGEFRYPNRKAFSANELSEQLFRQVVMEMAW